MFDHKDGLQNLINMISKSVNFNWFYKEFEEVQKRFDSEAKKRLYTSCSNTDIRGYYSKVPFRKTWVTNADLGKKLEGIPDNFEHVYEHDFDNMNRLVRTTRHLFGGNYHYHEVEFVFYEGLMEWSFIYSDHFRHLKTYTLTLSIFDTSRRLLTYETLYCSVLADIRDFFKSIPSAGYEYTRYEFTYLDDRVDKIKEYFFTPVIPMRLTYCQMVYDDKGYIIGCNFINERTNESEYYPIKKKFRVRDDYYLNA